MESVRSAHVLCVGSIALDHVVALDTPLTVGMTRGRQANHVQTAPPPFDPDQHGPARTDEAWTAAGALAAAAERQPAELGVMARRRELRGIEGQAGAACAVLIHSKKRSNQPQLPQTNEWPQRCAVSNDSSVAQPRTRKVAAQYGCRRPLPATSPHRSKPYWAV